jgi:rubrerythrin
MKQSTPPTGMNRTGIQMSPLDISELLDAVENTPPEPPGDESMMNQMRGDYAAQSDPIGSMPPPGTMKGMAKTGIAAMAGEHPQLLLDKLGERLAFERTSVRLYEGLIAKVQAGADSAAARQMTPDELMHIRNEEAAHFWMVSSAIEQLGGDPTSQTPCADLAGVESLGLMQVINDPRTTVVQSLHAILTGELADNAGWETLIGLARDQGHDEMVRNFETALVHEREHLVKVRAWYEGMLGLAQGAAQSGAMPATSASGTMQAALDPMQSATPEAKPAGGQ